MIIFSETAYMLATFHDVEAQHLMDIVYVTDYENVQR